MDIILNGQKENIENQTSLKAMIGQSCKDPTHVIAELNGVIVKKDSWEKHTLKDGDALELVNFVGGG